MSRKFMLVSVFHRQTGEETSQFCGEALHRNAILVQKMKVEYMCQAYRRSRYLGRLLYCAIAFKNGFIAASFPERLSIIV